MLNRVWFWLLLIGIVYGFGKGAVGSYQLSHSQPGSLASAPAAATDIDEATVAPLTLTESGKRLNEAAVDAAKVSVEICIQLIGIMALWLGLLKIADDAGLVASLAWLLRPLMRWLFPGVPDGHPAQGAMLMNISANMLGLDNAATPMGLKAMKELQTLNRTEDTATNAMATFLALNTSSVTIIPFTIIGYRAAADSENPVGPLFATILVTSVSTIVAVIAVRWLAKRPQYALNADASSNEMGADK